MADATKASTSESLDAENLAKDPERIKILMKRDPKFITRLISELDKSMHKRMLQKLQREEEMAAAQKEIDKINDTIRTHITPNVERLDASIKAKKALREQLVAQIDAEVAKVRNLEAEARALIQKSRHAAGKLYRTTAAQRLEEARGYSGTTPTTTLLRSGSSPSATATAKAPATS